mmetsp:Transcript_90395/g.256013  ORF Transcript_90395/g.256013 Transcript_90395/m.256013 type:complete len:350 (+) Transcript_90395:82-1131(+)
MVAASVADYSSASESGSLEEELPLERTRSLPDLGRPITLAASLPHCSHSAPELAGGNWEWAVDTESEVSTSPQCSWQIVWCHERSHKNEVAHRRKVLGDAARAAGASLVCLKKASKFDMWLAKAQRPPFVLLTDWREVKPCLQAASQEHLCNQPVFTVVLCEESQKHFDRAANWAEGLPPRQDPVHVCRDLSFLLSFVANIGSRSQPAPAPPPGTFMRGGTVTQAGVQAPQAYNALLEARMPTLWASSTMAMPPRGSGMAGIMGTDVAAEQTQYFPVSVVPPAAQLLSTRPMSKATLQPTSERKSLPWAAMAVAMAQPVADVLSPVCASQDLDQVEQLLQAAMPDVYDD